MRIVAVAIAVVLSGGITGVLGSQTEDFAALEQQATQILRADAGSFSSLAALVACLQTASDRAPDTGQRGRLALLWLRTRKPCVLRFGRRPLWKRSWSIKPATVRRLTREAIALDRKLGDPTDAARLKGR